MTAQLLPLRDYQRATIDALRADWAGGLRRLAAVLPTGAGKTVIFAHLIREMTAVGARVLVLAHRDELIEQAVGKLHDVAPHLRVGVVKGNRREILGRDVIVGSVQSCRSERNLAALRAAGVALVIVDECHHSTASTYLRVLRALGCFDEGDSGALLAGFTATLVRGDGVALGEVFEKVSYRVDIRTLIRRGYLLNAIGRRVQIDGFDLRAVKRTAGDYRAGALGAAMSAAMAPQAVARAYAEHAADRQGIVFWPTVELAYDGAKAFEDAGFPSIAADGTTKSDNRREALRRLKGGDAQVAHNAMLWTEGFDEPALSAVVIARPTTMPGLYAQMVGRVLRPNPKRPDVTHALVLDVVGVTAKHRLATLADLSGGDLVPELDDDDLLTYEDEEADEGLLLADDEPHGGPEIELVDGALVSEEVELFEGSRHRWLQTERGVWFLPVGAELLCLVPGSGPDLWSVCAMMSEAPGGRWIVQDVSTEGAMAWAEESAVKTFTSREASWRGRKPSQAIAFKARSLGIDPELHETQGELADAISVRLATRRVDHLPLVAGVTR